MIKAAVSGLILLGFSLSTEAKHAFFEKKVGDSVLVLSTHGTSYPKDVRKAKMVPRGSAVLTPSGELSKVGIQHIIHAASGSMTNSGKNFRPSMKGLKLSIENSLLLAEHAKVKCVAVPFIGGGIFLRDLKTTKDKLAKKIVSIVAASKSSVPVVFVTWGTEDTAIFKKALPKNAKGMSVLPGSITDGSLHKCEAIVNAANMEVSFGGGISGVIGDATGQAAQIDGLASSLIEAYLAP